MLISKTMKPIMVVAVDKRFVRISHLQVMIMMLISLLLFPKIIPTICDSTDTLDEKSCTENQLQQQNSGCVVLNKNNNNNNNNHPMKKKSPLKATTINNSKNNDGDYLDEQLNLASTFYKLLQTIQAVTNNTDKSYDVEDNHENGIKSREYVILSHWMKLIGMDHHNIFLNNNYIHQWQEEEEEEGDDINYFNNNWLEELHQRTMALAPDAFWKVYSKRPNNDEFRILTDKDEESREMAKNNHRKLRVYAFREHRERGLVSRFSHIFGKTVLLAIQHHVSYATPNESALRRIAHHAPLLEVGAGTGYWSAILQQRGVDILSYDIHPPTKSSENKNVFFTNTYTNVAQGSCSSLFNGQNGLSLAQRTLLIIWPNNPDNVDNLQFSIKNSFTPKVWDTECLSAFIANGGTTVIYVGEREEQIQLMNHDAVLPDCGMSATRQFQNMLKDKFILQEQVDIPTWWNVDDLTIWKIRN